MSFLVLVLVLMVSRCQGYFVRVTTHDNGGCGGHSRTDDLDFVCLNFPTWGYSISSVSIPIGSCAKIHTEQNCGGNTVMISYPQWQLCDLPCCGWNDHVLSIEDCNTRIASGNCPDGSYIREITYGFAHQGLTIFCYKPLENEPNFVYNTHGSPISSPVKTKCAVAAHGLSLSFDEEWRLFLNPVMECSRFETMGSHGITGHKSKVSIPTQDLAPSPSDLELILTKQKPRNVQSSDEARHSGNRFSQEMATVMCNQQFALTGMQAEIDDGGSIKAAAVFCSKVGDPSQMCEPRESLGLVIQCDNWESGNEIHCGYSQTIGVGQSRTITETEGKELTFSVEFGYSFGSTLRGLSASMSTTLGYSELVSYEWSQSDTTTWTLEETRSATIIVRPYTNSKLEQLIGKCSFYGTSVNYFKQTDVNKTLTTVQYFKIDLLGNKVNL